jgi:hypothetical protein
MNKCKAFKNKYEQIQCTSKSKDGKLYCGKHKNTIKPAFDIIVKQVNTQEIIVESTLHTKQTKQTKQTNRITRNTIFRVLGNVYTDYLHERKQYIRDSIVKDKNKHIEIIEYIENNKLDYYPNSRILASLEYYKLCKIQDTPKFIIAFNNINLLVSLFETLIRVNLNLDKIIKLQKWIHKSLINFKYKIHGNAIRTLSQRALCVNDSDFVSLDELKDISEIDFISFTDDTGFIYGFHIDSIAELIFKSDETYYENFKKHSSTLCYKQFIKTLFNHYNKIKIFNPYTRFIINGSIKLNVIRLFTQRAYTALALANIQGFHTVQNNYDNQIRDIKVLVCNKCFSIFQKIDMLGYFTNTIWLLDENIKIIKIFYKKLANLWNFEFGLDNTARYKISKTHNLFNNLHEIMISRSDKYTLLDKILDAINILVSNGETEGERNTGCILVLYGLAFINPNCIQSNPWLS